MFPLLAGDASLGMNIEKKNRSKTENKGVVVSDAELLKLPVFPNPMAHSDSAQITVR